MSLIIQNKSNSNCFRMKCLSKYINIRVCMEYKKQELKLKIKVNILNNWK